MPTITFREIKKGSVILVEGEPYEVLDRSFRAKQQNKAMATVNMKNLLTKKVLEKNFQSSAPVEEVSLEESRAQFLYKDGKEFHFMDQETYDQFSLEEKQLGDAMNYLKEEIVVRIKKFNDKPIDIILPAEVSLKVIDSPPGVKGDTAQGGSKTVTLETGMKMNVPLFIKEGENLIIKTKTGNFDRRE
ncbi:MAG: elongation factor P, partial [Candidatus Pacebacteria bacterium]|nr:elongation factor P [Candidatus Paceibacterota bacterium]